MKRRPCSKSWNIIKKKGRGWFNFLYTPFLTIVKFVYDEGNRGIPSLFWVCHTSHATHQMWRPRTVWFMYSEWHIGCDGVTIVEVFCNSFIETRSSDGISYDWFLTFYKLSLWNMNLDFCLTCKAKKYCSILKLRIFDAIPITLFKNWFKYDCIHVPVHIYIQCTCLYNRPQ